MVCLQSIFKCKLPRLQLRGRKRPVSPRKAHGKICAPATKGLPRKHPIQGQVFSLCDLMRIKNREKGNGKLTAVVHLSKEVPELLKKTTLLLLIQKMKMNNIKTEITLKISTNSRYWNKYIVNCKVRRRQQHSRNDAYLQEIYNLLCALEVKMGFLSSPSLASKTTPHHHFWAPGWAEF